MGKRQCGKNAKGTAQPKAGRRYLRKIPGKNPGTKAKQTHDKPGGYQALEREEIHFLEPTDINLEKGTVRIRKNTQLQGRVLKLTANQILPLQEYMSEIRPEFVKLKGKQSGLSGVAKTEKLFIIIGTSQHIKDSMRKLLRELKKEHPFLNSFTQIRISVISQWVKEKNIREVQYMSGHAGIYSTQRYIRANLDDLKDQLALFHPLQ